MALPPFIGLPGTNVLVRPEDILAFWWERETLDTRNIKMIPPALVIYHRTPGFPGRNTFDTNEDAHAAF